MAVNARGVFIGLSQLLPEMGSTGGGVITILSSTGGLRGTLGYASYVASKHAVIGLMRCAALEGAPLGIRVNTVNPGPINTRMLASIEDSRNALRPDGEKRDMKAVLPLKRLGEPEDVANMIAFLSSAEGSFCTGQTYVTDGGSMIAR